MLKVLVDVKNRPGVHNAIILQETDKRIPRAFSKHLKVRISCKIAGNCFPRITFFWKTTDKFFDVCLNFPCYLLRSVFSRIELVSSISGLIHTTREKCLKSILVSTLMGTVHTNPEKLPTENREFRKRSSSWMKLRILVWTEKNLQTELSENDDITSNHVINPAPQGWTQAFLPPVIAAFSNLSDIAWKGRPKCSSETWHERKKDRHFVDHLTIHQYRIICRCLKLII